MDKTELREIFDQYVFGFIRTDIEREIWLARKFESDQAEGRELGPHPGGGNVLAALGLVSFTEFVGSLIAPGEPTSERKFLAVLAEMDECYEQFAKEHTRDPTLYTIYRSDLAHRYSINRDLMVYMLKGKENCGLGRDKKGRYYFVVERYFDDFMRFCHDYYEKNLK